MAGHLKALTKSLVGAGMMLIKAGVVITSLPLALSSTQHCSLRGICPHGLKKKSQEEFQ